MDHPTQNQDSTQQASNALAQRVAIRTSALSLLALTPFLVYRISLGEWDVVLFLASLMVLFAAVMESVRRGGSGQAAMHIVAATYSAALVIACHFRGFPAIFWLYPVVVANFFFLPRKSAVLINILAIVLTLPTTLAEGELGLRVLGTLSLVFGLGWVYSRQLEQHQTKLARAALEDGLTGVGNRLALEEELLRAGELFRRYGRAVSLVILDIDHFKSINDRIGHPGGDKTLQLVAQQLQRRLRASDHVFRYGGEEFVLLLPETSLDNALAAAEGLRTEMPLVPGTAESVRFSAGVAEHVAGEDVEAWLRRADEALYRAKRAGRDRIVEADHASTRAALAIDSQRRG